jgi:hypothetical protein
VELAREDKGWWQTLARRVNRLNCRDLVLIAWLYVYSSAYSVCTGYYLRRSSDSYYEPCLVKIVGISILYAIRLARLLHKLVLGRDLDRILTERTLTVEAPSLLGL